MSLFTSIAPTTEERRASLPGDFVVPVPDVVLDRSIDVPATPQVLWPWIVQLGKKRGGWYLPETIERWIPESRRGLREVDTRYQKLAVGSVVPDWGGQRASFEVALLEPESALVYRSQRGRVKLSWAIVLTATGDEATRLQLRLRLGGVRHRRLARSAGGLLDRVTVAGLAAGLDERMRRAA
jgi:hypothetical protein